MFVWLFHFRFNDLIDALIDFHLWLANQAKWREREGGREYIFENVDDIVTNNMLLLLLLLMWSLLLLSKFNRVAFHLIGELIMAFVQCAEIYTACWTMFTQWDAMHLYWAVDVWNAYRTYHSDLFECWKSVVHHSFRLLRILNDLPLRNKQNDISSNVSIENGKMKAIRFKWMKWAQRFKFKWNALSLKYSDTPTIVYVLKYFKSKYMRLDYTFA